MYANIIKWWAGKTSQLRWEQEFAFYFQKNNDFSVIYDISVCGFSCFLQIQFTLLKVSITSRCSGMEHGEVDQTRAGELRISSLLCHQKTFFDVMQIETKYKGYESEGYCLYGITIFSEITFTCLVFSKEKFLPFPLCSAAHCLSAFSRASRSRWIWRRSSSEQTKIN